MQTRREGKSQCHVSDLWRSAAEGGTDPVGGAAVTHRVCQSKWPGKMWLIVSLRAPTATTTTSHLPQPFPQFILDVCTSESWRKQRTNDNKNKKNKKTKQKQKTNKTVPLQIPKQPNCFYKTWTAWYVFPRSCFNLTRFLAPRKKANVFNSIFKLRDVVLLPFYKVCSL